MFPFNNSLIRFSSCSIRAVVFASSPLANQSWGTLTVQKPHPAGLPGMARVTFAIDSSAAMLKAAKKRLAH